MVVTFKGVYKDGNVNPNGPRFETNLDLVLCPTPPLLRVIPLSQTEQ